jgi:hypothetical protein
MCLLIVAIGLVKIAGGRFIYPNSRGLPLYALFAVVIGALAFLVVVFGLKKH